MMNVTPEWVICIYLQEGQFSIIFKVPSHSLPQGFFIFTLVLPSVECNYQPIPYIDAEKTQSERFYSLSQEYG